MLEVATEILFAAGVSGIFAMMFLASRRAQEAREEAWQAAATRLGGQFSVRRVGLIATRLMSIQANVEGAAVFVDHYKVSSGRSSQSYTRVRAEADAPAEFDLRFEQGVLASLGKALGAQDVIMGDKAFDDAFVIKTNDEDLALLWLEDRRVRSLALEALPYLALLERRKVAYVREGLEDSSADLVRAAHATAALARRGARLREEWLRLAEGLGGIVEREPWGDEDPKIVVEARGAMVAIELAHLISARGPKKERLITRVSAHRSDPGEDRFVGGATGTLTEADGEIVLLEGSPRDAVEVRSNVPEVTKGRLDRDLVESLEGLTSARLMGGAENVAVMFPGMVVDTKLVARAVKVVAALAATDTSIPYR